MNLHSIQNQELVSIAIVGSSKSWDPATPTAQIWFSLWLFHFLASFQHCSNADFLSSDVLFSIAAKRVELTALQTLSIRQKSNSLLKHFSVLQLCWSVVQTSPTVAGTYETTWKPREKYFLEWLITRHYRFAQEFAADWPNTSCTVAPDHRCIFDFCLFLQYYSCHLIYLEISNWYSSLQSSIPGQIGKPRSCLQLVNSNSPGSTVSAGRIFLRFLRILWSLYTRQPWCSVSRRFHYFQLRLGSSATSIVWIHCLQSCLNCFENWDRSYSYSRLMTKSILVFSNLPHHWPKQVPSVTRDHLALDFDFHLLGRLGLRSVVLFDDSRHRSKRYCTSDFDYDLSLLSTFDDSCPHRRCWLHRIRRSENVRQVQRVRDHHVGSNCSFLFYTLFKNIS